MPRASQLQMKSTNIYQMTTMQIRVVVISDRLVTVVQEIVTL